LIKTAKVTITDERVVTKRISATCEELGLDPKSEDFEAQFREKAIALLQQSGYTVDPSTFSLNEVNVSADGYVSASVTSRFTKSFDASEAGPAEYPNEAEGTEGENLGPIGQAEEVATEGAKELRASKRKAILERIAQIAGMGMPGAPAAAPAPAPAPAGAPMGADLAGGGLGALTMADEDAGAAEADSDTDSMPEPGKKSPPGSICPACGSRNVDLADGKGHCNSCQTDMEVKYQITITPSSDTENDKSEGESAAAEAPAPEAPLGGDVGLGAATAPAPEAGAPAMGAPAAPPAAGMTPMAASTPPVMVRISWKQDPEVFIKAAQADFDPNNEKTLPVGHVCPSCGNRKAKKVKSTRFCYSCGEVYIPRIHKSSDKTKVEVSIDKIV
jgi:ssDNA-binding Zn-finger/Zn-ribbon topoisomerase 1